MASSSIACVYLLGICRTMSEVRVSAPEVTFAMHTVNLVRVRVRVRIRVRVRVRVRVRHRIS